MQVFYRYINTFKGLTRSVWILAFVMFINRSGTMVIPFLTIYLTKELGFTLVDAGYIMSIFGIGSVVGTYIGGQLTDRYGYYPVMKYSLIGTGIMFMLLSYAYDFWSFVIMIFLTSTVADIFRPANMTAVASLSKEEDRTRSITLLRLAINAGWSIGPAIGGLMIAYIGYDFLFLADGITNILAAVFLALILKEKTTSIKNEESDSLSDDSPKWPSKFMWFIVVNTLIMIPFFQLFNAIPVYFRSELMLREDVIGALMAINGILLVVFEMPIVYSLEKKYNVLKIILVGMFLIGVSYLLLITSDSLLIAALCIFGLTAGEVLQMPFANSYVISLADNNRMGKYLAMYGVSFSVALIISPTLGLYIAQEYGYDMLWISMAVLSLISLFLMKILVIDRSETT